MKSTKEICIRYITSLHFSIDILAVIPLRLFLPQTPSLNALKLLKLLSLWKVSFLSQSIMMRVVSKLLTLILTLLIYINFSTCLLYYVAEIGKQWTPPVELDIMEPVDFYNLPVRSKYLATMYASILVLTGNEINPVSDLQVGVASILTILGSLIIANIFGTFAVVVT